jgi:ribosomal protein S18 acetylase RimI-like enzyme
MESTRDAKLLEDQAALAKRMARRVRFYRRVGLFGNLPEPMWVERALDPETLWEAWCLVHDCYVDCEYIVPDPTGARVRSFEAMPEMANFVVKDAGRVVAVMSVIGDTDQLGLPSDKVYGDAIDQLRQRGRRVCEITNLAVHPDYRNQPVFSELTQAAFAHARCLSYDDMFISISPDHVPFFGEVLCFDPCGGKRVYDRQTEDVVVGMRLDIRAALDRAAEIDVLLADKAFLQAFYFTENPFVSKVHRWAIRALQLFNNPAALGELYVRRAGLFERIGRDEHAAVAARWRPEVYRQVVRPEDVPGYVSENSSADFQAA